MKCAANNWLPRSTDFGEAGGQTSQLSNSEPRETFRLHTITAPTGGLDGLRRDASPLRDHAHQHGVVATAARHQEPLRPA